MWQVKLRELLRFRKPWIWLLLAFVLWGLILGVLAPWLIKKELQKIAEQRLDAQLTIERLRINPYLFTLTVEDLALSEKQQALFGFSRLYINFQTSSLFRWAWTLKEAHLLGVYTNVERYDTTSSNLSQLAARWEETAAPAKPENESDGAASSSNMPRLLIQDIQLQITRISVLDKVPATPFTADLGPIKLKIADLSTLPEQSGEQRVSITTEHGTRIQWDGSISLQPLASSGSLSVAGPLFQIASEYLRDSLNFQVAEDTVTANLHYNFAMVDEQPTLRLDDIQCAISKLEVFSKPESQPLFKLPQLTISDGLFSWPENTLEITAIDFQKAQLWLARDSEGIINLSQLIDIEPATKPDAELKAVEEPKTTRFYFHNQHFKLSDWTLHFRDESLPKPADLDVEKISLHVQNLSNQQDTPIELQFSAGLAAGLVESSGQLTPQPFGNLAMKVNIAQLDFAALQPYIEPYANVTLEKSLLDLSADITADDAETIAIRSDASLSEFKLSNSKTEKTLLSWNALSANDITTQISPLQVAVGKIELDQAYVDFAIDADGKTTIDHVLIPQAQVIPAETTEEETKPKQAVDFSIASIAIKAATGNFSDQSLPLPFATAFSDLNGDITTIASTSNEPADVELKGRVDEYGAMALTGNITPFQPEANTNLDLTFRNVNIPNFSPYSMKFAGRKIEEGKLNLKLGYEVVNSKLEGSNNIELQEFKLGERVDQPGAMDLPLDMAIALLKDSQGNIEIDLPVSGDMNNPEFQISKVIGQAFSRMITSIVTAPFRLLGSLVGGGSEDFGHILFAAGSAEIAPPEQEKLVKLGEALSKRPQLQLQIQGVYNAALDIPALQTLAFEQVEIAHFGEEKVAAISRVSKPYIRFVESLYLEKNSKEALTEIENQFTSTNSENGKSELDTLAYANYLREIATADIQISSESLEQLGDDRGKQLQQFMLDQQLLTPERIALEAPSAIESKKAEYIPLELELNIQE